MAFLYAKIYLMKVKSNKTTEKIVYFVRHGQSVDNVAPVFQSLDSPLSEVGIKQAEFIAKRVSNIPFEKLISSPLMRTRQTAEAISKATNMPIVFSNLFVEKIRPSSINGKPYKDPEAEIKSRAWENSLVSEGVKIEDGENYSEIIKRANDALNYLYEQPEKTMVVVTHSYFLRVLEAKVLLGNTLSPESFNDFTRVISTENTGITVFKFEGAFEQYPCWRLWIHNDHAHLAES